MRPHKLFVALALMLCVVVGCAPFVHVPPVVASTSNTHARPNSLQEMQAWFGDGLIPYLVPNSGCPPSPGGGLTLGAFPCQAYVRGALGDLVYVNQTAAAVGPLNSGNGTYWLAIHRDATTAVGGWTRQAGTAYLWQFNASQPTSPVNALVFAQVTVSGGAITDVTAVVATSPITVLQPMLNVLDPVFGTAVCGPVGNTQAALNLAAINNAITAASTNIKGSRTVFFPCRLNISTGLVLSGMNAVTLLSLQATSLPLNPNGPENTLVSLDNTQPVITVSHLSESIELHGLQLGYDTQAAGSVCAVNWQDSTGAMFWVNLLNNIGTGICNTSSSSGPVGEKYFVKCVNCQIIAQNGGDGIKVRGNVAAGRVIDWVSTGVNIIAGTGGHGYNFGEATISYVELGYVLGGDVNYFINGSSGASAHSVWLRDVASEGPGCEHVGGNYGNHIQVKGGNLYGAGARTSSCDGIRLGPGTKDISIVGNDIYDGAHGGIRLEGDANQGAHVASNRIYRHPSYCVSIGSISTNNNVMSNRCLENAAPPNTIVEDDPTTANVVGPNQVTANAIYADFAKGINIDFDGTVYFGLAHVGTDFFLPMGRVDAFLQYAPADGAFHFSKGVTFDNDGFFGMAHVSGNPVLAMGNGIGLAFDIANNHFVFSRAVTFDNDGFFGATHVLGSPILSFANGSFIGYNLSVGPRFELHSGGGLAMTVTTGAGGVILPGYSGGSQVSACFTASGQLVRGAPGC